VAYAIIRVAKQKGGSVGASGRHNDRTRETPNADPERSGHNRVLLGEDRDVRELVTRVIEEHGGKPRSDSVECVEMILTASPEHFLDEDEEEREKKIERFVERSIEFLRDERNCGACVKAVLHLDERTPHVHAHKVPIDPEGKLNAKHYLGGRQKLRALQDRYAEAMAPLGLERGREGSRATHQTVKQFYAAIEKVPALKVDLDRVPDPPAVMVTREQKKTYKKEVLKAFNEQIKEPLRTIHQQAMLARDERNRRVEIEARASAQVKEALAREQAALAKVRPLESLNERLWDENRYLKREDVKLRRALSERDERLRAAGLKIQEFEDRRRDVPLPDLMARLGYPGEAHGDRVVYRSAEGQTVMTIADGRVFNHEHLVICRNSVELVAAMRTAMDGQECTKERAVEWLAEHFGEGRAEAAYLVERGQALRDGFERRREEERRRERPQTERAAPAPTPTFDRDDDREGFVLMR
jgi:hypothetical protein